MSVERRRLLAFLAFAAVWKALYLLEYASLPFLEAPIFDSLVYLRQAEAVRALDLAHPTLLAFSPLYGYFLAIFEPIAIPLQLAMGVTSLALFHYIGKTLFDEETGLAAAMLAFGYGLFTFYETKIMSEALSILLVLGSYALFVSPRFARGERVASVASGLLFGFAILARASLLFCGPMLALFSLLPLEKGEGRARYVRAALFSVGLAIVLCGNGFANLSRTGFFVPVIFVSSTAARASQSDWSGDFSAFGAAPSAWDVVDQAESRLAGERVESPAIDPLGVLKGALPKAALTFRNEETTFDYGFYGERTECTALRLLALPFMLVLLLALVGAGLLVRKQGARALVRFMPLVLGILATTVLFHPSSRYRLAMLVPLVLLGAHALMQLRHIADAKRRKLALGALGVVAAAFIAASFFHPLSSPGMWELRVAEAEVTRGDVDSARARIAQARTLEPSSPAVAQRAAYIEAMMQH